MRQLPFEYAYRNIGRSRSRLVATVGGAALVVLLVLASAGFVRGMSLTLVPAARLQENVILLGAGSEEAIERSQIDANVATIAAASVPNVKEADGVPLVSPEVHMALIVRTERDSAVEREAVMRGVRPVALLVHPQVELVEGRFPRPGRDELMVGSLTATQLGVAEERLAVGRTLWFDDRAWTISGRFSAPTSVMNAEVWLPLTDLQVATRRESTISCVILTLSEEGRVRDADIFAKTRLDLEIAAVGEEAYYAGIAAFYGPIRAMIVVTAALIALGAVLGGLNTIYAGFAARVREIGMLQALGYRRSAVVLSLLEESLFTAAIGAVVGVGVGLVVLDGVAVRFSMGAFALTLDGPVVLTGLLGGLAVGLVGAVPPAVRCLRMPITQALKSF